MTEEWEWKEFAEFARAKQELQDAEHRVAEAALRYLPTRINPFSGTVAFDEQRNCLAELVEAVHDLHRLMEGK